MEIHWAPGIGDPTLAGWLTVLAYLVAASLCAASSIKASAIVSNTQSEQRFWLGVSFVLLALGINKQLDLQSLLTEWGRAAARAEGWYDHRRFAQAAFVGAFGFAGASGLTILLWRFRDAEPAVKLATVGLTVTLIFVVVRAASFHHIDLWLNDTLLGLRWDWVLELAAIAIVAIAALLRIMQLGGEGRAATR